jgi:pyruvate carboxylase
VPVITGSDRAFDTPGEAEAWINDPANRIAFPVIVKAAMGGGGRGIRIVPAPGDLESMFRLASNEALNAFGDGRCFVEKYVDRPRHIEVQCLGDGGGDVVHLFDRDCSVQRRHQKVVETAPVTGLPRETRENMFRDACRLLSMNKYRNAGTVEFLVDKDGNHYFMEVNPRVQVEHVSENVGICRHVRSSAFFERSAPPLLIIRSRCQPSYANADCHRRDYGDRHSSESDHDRVRQDPGRDRPDAGEDPRA